MNVIEAREVGRAIFAESADALFLFDRYIQTVTSAVRENGGHVNGIAGDGVMSVGGS